MYDVAVIGGSLAGAATALHLARTGHSVILIERSRNHRPKACGEGLFPRGVGELGSLGILDEALRQAAPLSGIRFHAAGFEVQSPFGPGEYTGLGIERSHLDPLILKAACRAGVEVHQGVTMRSLLPDGERFAGVQTSDGDIRARVVIGADGIGSRVRRQAGLDRRQRGNRYGISAHIRVASDPQPFVDVYFCSGYEVYVTPVAHRTVNVAVLLKKRMLRRVRPHLDAWFAAAVKAAVGSSTHETLDVPHAAGPFGVTCTRPWRRNLVLVGDAAGFFDAISGEGMSSALISARYCAAAVDEYLGTGDESAFRHYARQRSALVQNSDALARLTLALAASRATARLSIRHLSRHPAIFARLVSISTGELPLTALRPADVLALVPFP